ncbi:MULTISPECIES: hypothetical protein [Stutzerimonas stutzeri subgroup]|jgi:uncharacterized protein involved in copper resistance|uniref:Copper resistance protein B n=1 Tax=Stutzerimonas stutzeri TaxID=316 RepID=A0A2N8RJW0_STUST|nr:MULTISPECIES: hypothetical protein [Stutzerimonas stutzeri subgroup]EHY76274.1 hypothetical protein PstZobell_02401 [Stutzerimonas stutzeri ATCC 14405 = CCUG 16156]MBA1241060.1 hypothetical protein [Stutzerimonas kunmingensis]MCQ4252360.1 hypothetical protein [Stutzerimonas stutzeri]PNF61394.1 hypothetical protein CXK99_01255 [Stutzerimonas stutzeri]QOZ96289.1 hypothetical protein Pstu14405_13565 [Stutzerimonas stutzeri]
MSNLLKRKALFGGVAVLSLIATLYVPTSTANQDHNEHAQHSAETHKGAGGKAAPASQEKTSQMKQMDHGAMDHGSMNHDGMDHKKMMGGHGGKAEAGSNHDH